MKICNICGSQFENHKKYSNHVRWKHKRIDTNCIFCGRVCSCNKELHEAACSLNPIHVKRCKNCNNILKDKKAEFCNHSCSAIYSNAIRNPIVYSKKKMTCIECGKVIIGKNKTKQFCFDCIKKHITKQHTGICVSCRKQFTYNSQIIKQTCSERCFKQLLSKLSKDNLNCGGETHFKKYVYRNHHLDSSWELEIAQWLDKNNIQWIRTRKLVFWWTDKTNQKRRYYPDFFLPEYNLYLDPKNSYKLLQDQYKLDQVVKENSIKLLYGDKDKIIREVGKLNGAVAKLA